MVALVMMLFPQGIVWCIYENKQGFDGLVKSPIFSGTKEWGFIK